MNDYLVPANAKKSTLFLGFLKPVPDLIVAGAGLLVTVGILMFIDTNQFWPTLGACIPALICIGLVVPIPNYHNVMTAIGIIFKFYTNSRTYKWKGWCIKDELDNE